MAATEVRARARAKVNLTLHVTGQRSNGYHELDSLVVFADVHDEVQVKPGDDLKLVVEGPEAMGLAGEGDNLVLRAARCFNTPNGAALRLTKCLPVASGIGGGSADAAAALVALAEFWDLPLPPAEAVLGLGADVPVCLQGLPTRLRGIGEVLEPLPDVPGALVLVNPRVGVATPPVFRALASKTNPPMPDTIPAFADAQTLADWLSEQRNDLEQPAMELCPQIADVLAALRMESPLLARMSGSGATCFGLYPSPAEAERGAAAIAAANPGGWVKSAAISSR